jgi:prepilin-type N-terminal cleavage/methylation domain-containing protein
MSINQSPLRPISGFTLIELLVVISIISLLISILLPALQSARETSQVVQTLSNLRQIQIALHNYAGDNRDFLPPRDGNPGSGSASLFPFWPGRLVFLRYTSDPFVFWGARRDTSWFGTGSFHSRTVMKNTPLSANSYQYPGFAASQYVMGTGAGVSWVRSHRLGTQLRVHSDAVNKKPGDSDILVMTEATIDSASGGELGYWEVRHSGDAWKKLFTYRGASSTAYLDGHVVSVDSLNIGWRALGDRGGSWYPASHAYYTRQEPWFSAN